jgi:hypothetical protein
MPTKKANDATIAPPPVSDSSVPVVKKNRTKAVAAAAPVKAAKTVTPRRKSAPKTVVAGNDSIVNLVDAVESPSVLDGRAIEERAYQSWLERGCPMGSPQEDWYRAERELIARFATAGK